MRPALHAAPVLSVRTPRSARRALLSCAALGAFVAALAAPAALSAAPAFPAVTLDGIGGVTPGMTPAAVARAWGVTVGPVAAASPCAAVAVRSGRVRGSAIFEHGTLGAVFFSAGARTGAGVAIGSSLPALRTAYGARLRSQPNKYVAGGRDYYLTRARAPHWQLRLDVSPAGKVVSVAFGSRAVHLVEGCA
jgi:hypothetical protein